MKRSTAIGHLAEMADVASQSAARGGGAIDWPLRELWVTGELLGLADTVDTASVVLVLDVPGEELPWLALDPSGEWVGSVLRLGKRPIRWCYRPADRPVWNHEHRRLVRFWSAYDGTDEAVLEALRARRLDRLGVVEPTAQDLATLLDEELAVSRRHLRAVLDAYWDRDWRRAHKGYDSAPDDHLWRAAAAVSEMLDARDQLER